MKEGKPLDTNSGWENVVNPRTAANRKRTEEKARTFFWWCKAMVLTIVITAVLWVCEEIDGAPALIVSEVATFVAAFLGGRLYEMTNK